MKPRTGFIGPKRHPGITLIELLVVIALIALMASVLLQSIQYVREGARRLSCENNLKQTGLAIQNFESTNRHLPPGARAGSTFGLSWWTQILPFLEESSKHDQIDQNGPHAGWALLNAQNSSAADRFVISTFLCPSSPIPELHQMGAIQIMMPSYVGISGATNHDGFAETRVSQCCAPLNDGQISSGGTLIPNEVVKLSQITDGMSKTFAVGETSDYAFDSNRRRFRIDGGMPFGWMTGTMEKGTPPNYGSSNPTSASWNLTTIRYPINTRDYSLPGIYDDHGANNPLVSAHASGVFVLLMDGSVRFLTDDTDLRHLKMMATRDDALTITAAN